MRFRVKVAKDKSLNLPSCYTVTGCDGQTGTVSNNGYNRCGITWSLMVKKPEGGFRSWTFPTKKEAVNFFGREIVGTCSS